MSLASILAAALCPLALAQQPTHGARASPAQAPRLHLEAPRLFDANLPRCFRLRPSVDGLAALAEHEQYLVTDASEGKATGWTTESGQRVQDVATWDHSFVRLLVRCDGTIALEASTQNGWEELRGKSAGPELRCDPTLVAQDSCPFLAADGERVVVITDTAMYSYCAGEWSSSVLALEHDGAARPIHRVLLDRETLYVGTDMGEWGGDLYSVDVETRLVTKISAAWKNGDSNVADLDRGPDGRIWATIGCIHGLGWGSIYVRSGDVWTCVAKTPGCKALEGRPDSEWPEVVPATNRAGELPWKIAPTEFTALDFDRNGRAYLLTESLGLFRLDEGGRWTWVTPGWPAWGANATDLAIIGTTAVISSRSAGVIVVDLDTLAARRVRLE